MDGRCLIPILLLTGPALYVRQRGAVLGGSARLGAAHSGGGLREAHGARTAASRCPENSAARSAPLPIVTCTFR